MNYFNLCSAWHRWEFKTDGYDIGFGVFRQDGGEKVAVLPVERVNSHMVPEDGSYSCDVSGTCRSLAMGWGGKWGRYGGDGGGGGEDEDSLVGDLYTPFVMMALVTLKYCQEEDHNYV